MISYSCSREHYVYMMLSALVAAVRAPGSTMFSCSCPREQLLPGGGEWVEEQEQIQGVQTCDMSCSWRSSS